MSGCWWAECLDGAGSAIEMEISLLMREEMDRMVPILEHAVGVQAHSEKLIRLVDTLLAV